MGEFERWQSRVTTAVAVVARFALRLPVAGSTWVVFGLALLLGFLPVFSRPGYESALLFGLLVPPITAISAALLPNEVGSVEPRLLSALRRAFAHAMVLTTVLSLHAAWVGWCAPGHDLLVHLLGPVVGIFAAAYWGCFVGVIAVLWEQERQRCWLRVALSWLGPLLGIVVGLATFYRSPSVFAFDPFVGFFAGSPYDTGFDSTPRLLSYRLGTVGCMLFLWALARHLECAPHGSFRFGRLDRAVAGIGLLGLGLFVAITALGEPLGHRSSTPWVRRSLGQSVTKGRCEVVFSATQKHASVLRLAEDCDAWLLRLERRLGVQPLEQVTAFVFDSSAQKELLMGAAHTQIAKPWRREIYLNGANYPDDVVGHELAHIVSGQAARGPFKVAGSLGGWLPDPGLIEGLAVALAPDEDGELTELEWSAALQSIGKRPALAQLFSLGFLQHSGPLAYTVAGAFVEWLGQNYGKVVVRRWYAGESIERAAGHTLDELELLFAKRLETVALPDGARQAALAKFARLGVYSRRCPHAVDRALGQAEQRLAAGDAEAACGLYAEARRLDASEVRARFGLGECAERAVATPAHEQRAEQAFRAIDEDASLPMPVRLRAREKLADLLFAAGNTEQARPLYDQLAEQTFDVDRRRSLDIKRDAKTKTEIQAVKTLLLGVDGESAWDVAVRDLLRWSTETIDDGTADYLLGRNYWQKGREGAAVEHLERSLARGIRRQEVHAEALRQRAIVACALKEPARALVLAERLSHEAHLPTPRRLGIQRIVERCAGRLVLDDWPEVANGVAPSPAAASTTMPQLPRKPQTPAATTVAYDSDAFECPEGMQKIRGAEFSMGARRGKSSPDESPRFRTRVRGFCLDRTEVTVAAFQRCVTESHCLPALGHSASCNARHNDRGNHPINCVDHAQAVGYCATRGARLPTEVEWEYAARGGPQALKYPWGDGPPDGRACWKNSSSCPVGSFAVGAFGLYDMIGNVWEWTATEYGAYPWSTPLSGEIPLKIYRGGGWSRRFEKWMQAGLRNRSLPRDAGAHLGFRCAQSLGHLSCPFDADAKGACLFGVLEVDCPTGQSWNGERCTKPSEPACPVGYHAEPGHGCLRDQPMVIKGHPADIHAVRRQRSTEFDADCRKNQPKRPTAYRYLGGSHAARNEASSGAGCKNRDVGAGWNSTCCP